MLIQEKEKPLSVYQQVIQEKIEKKLTEAKNALKFGDLELTIKCYKKVLFLDPNNP